MSDRDPIVEGGIEQVKETAERCGAHYIPSSVLRPLLTDLVREAEERGRKEAAWVECPECEGAGEQAVGYHDGMEAGTQDCPTCAGFDPPGKIPAAMAEWLAVAEWAETEARRTVGAVGAVAGAMEVAWAATIRAEARRRFKEEAP